MLLAHTKGKAAIKAAYPKLPVGVTLAIEDDFIGVQTYTRQRIGRVHANLPPPKDAELTQSGFEFYLEALEHAIRYASQEAGVSVIVTETEWRWTTMFVESSIFSEPWRV